MPTSDDISERIAGVFELAGIDPTFSPASLASANLLRSIVEQQFNTPPPELNEEFAALLRRISQSSTPSIQ